MSSERSPQLAEVLRDAGEAVGLELRVSCPARVVKVHTDASGNVLSVDCEPGVKGSYLDESDERQTETLPIVASVPVQQVGGGGYRATFPVAVGDTVLLIFGDRSLDRWLTGDGGAAVDPEIDHAHNLTDAVALLGVRPFGAPLSSAPSDHATMGKDNGPQVHFRGTTITVGDEAGAQFIALANLVQAELDKIANAFSTFVPGSGGASFPNPYVTSSSVAAAQAKAK